MSAAVRTPAVAGMPATAETPEIAGTAATVGTREIEGVAATTGVPKTVVTLLLGTPETIRPTA